MTAILVLSGCGDDPLSTSPDEEASAPACTVPRDLILDGGPGKDGIPSLQNPHMVRAGMPEADYVDPTDRVIGIELDGQAYAIPHSIGWWHEIVNLDAGDEQVAVTYCPLTGSSMGFDRAVADGAEFGVSGLLYFTNLIMFDRNDEESLWSQMGRSGICGPEGGTPLEMVPVIEMTWDGWQALHPETWVPAHAPEEGQDFEGYHYPYRDYERPGNPSLLFPVPEIDPRRPPKERVLGIPLGAEGGVAFPFGDLDEGGEVNAVNTIVGSNPVVVFWDREWQAAVAYRPRIDDQHLSFEVRDGILVDLQTESTWQVDGRAVEGSLEGERLEPIAEAYVAFWFAWAVFQSETNVWGTPE